MARGSDAVLTVGARAGAMTMVALCFANTGCKAEPAGGSDPE